MGLTLLQAKIVALFGQVAVLMFFCLLPIKVENYVMKKGLAGQIFLSCCRCFGGGALVGSYMLHMTPEINHLLQSSLMDPQGITYPIPEIIAGFGFFLFLFIEWFVMWRDKKLTKATEAKKIAAGEMDAVVLSSISMDVDSNGMVGGSTSTLGTQNSTTELVKDAGKDIEKKADGDSASVGSTGDNRVSDPEAGARSLIMLIALSADGLFQGLAIGLKWTNVAVWNLFIAIVGHEFVVAFCLGLELVRSQPRKKVIISGVFYGLTPAVGTALGIVIFEVTGNNSDEQKVNLINGVLQSIATGVFLYVAFIGILGEEMTSNPRLASLLSVLGGYILMAALALLIPPPTYGQGHDTTSAPDIF